MRGRRKKRLVCIAAIGVLSACQSNPSVCVEEHTPRPPDNENPKWRESEALSIGRDAFDGSSSHLEVHANYLVMALPFEPMKPFFGRLQQRSERALISRGEAHVTVITPPEFEALKSKMSIDEINAIAASSGIQKARLNPLCLGAGHASMDGHQEVTFFIVIQSEDLLTIRRKIQTVYRERGGSHDSFSAEHFYPHVTVGFTKMDLHEQNGVIKGENSCLARLTLE